MARASLSKMPRYIECKWIVFKSFLRIINEKFLNRSSIFLRIMDSMLQPEMEELQELPRGPRDSSLTTRSVVTSSLAGQLFRF